MVAPPSEQDMTNAKQIIEHLDNHLQDRLPKIADDLQKRFEKEVRRIANVELREMTLSGTFGAPRDVIQEHRDDLIDRWADRWDAEMQRAVAKLQKKKRTKK